MAVSRRNFLTYLGLGTYALMRSSVRADAAPARFPLRERKPSPYQFKPISATTKDEVILPEGFDYQVICTYGDALGSTGPKSEAETFGYNNDLTVYFPIDALENGRNSSEGLLWVNHENPDPLFVSNYCGKPPKTLEQILAEKRSVGGSVLHVRKANGKWEFVSGSRFNRRLNALYPSIPFTGPAANSLPPATGTLANCSGGRTPWHTVLSCEENYPDYNSKSDEKYRWSDVADEAIDEREYGWVVEIDPFDTADKPGLKPVKHSALGRFKHENTALRWGAGKKGQLVVYMGDDEQDQFFYKFVSAEPYREEKSREDKRALLTQGTLYAADFAKGRWLPLDIGHAASRKKLQAAGFKTQAEVLLRCQEAAKALGATPIDRPEDCEVHPLDGSIYLALTNNSKHGNLFGQVVRVVEDHDDPASESFSYELFLAGGPQSGLACPDNLAFDRKGNLWVACDISSAAVAKGAYRPFGNNGLFVVPTAGPAAGEAYQFASGPKDAELTGPWFTDDEQTLFLSVQHPGEESRSKDEKDLTSHWPPAARWSKRADKLPRPAVIAITGGLPIG
jgi:secreted PhoX family phosphatase